MHDITVTGLSRVTNPKPNRGGSIVLAYFDCDANGFALHGCALVRTSRNGLTVWPPKLEGPESVRRSITFADSSLRHAVMINAQDAYRALGGTDAEWMPREDKAAGDEGSRADTVPAHEV